LSNLLQEYVTEQAERRGDAMALVMGDERLTYAQLEATSNRLAHLLVQVGCARGDRVCLFAAKSPAAVVAMLASLKAGCAYVPIDTASPAARVARIVRSAEPAAAVVLGPAVELLEEVISAGACGPNLPVGALNIGAQNRARLPLAFGPDDQAHQSDVPPRPVGDTADAAHILFTSGSTGEPKGVVITHANVRAFIEWAIPYFEIRPGNRISGHPPLHFDLSTFDIYGTFCAGAELHLVPPTTLLPRELANFILGGRLTQWFCVPSTMTYMAKLGGVPDGGFPSLERVLWCGEVLPTPVLIHWMQRVPQARFTNLYGPTEATIASSYHTVPTVPPDQTRRIPIGTACGGEELIVLDTDQRPAPHGAIGELYIGGAGLSPGYWRDREKSVRAFVPDPRPGRAGERLYRTGDLAQIGEDGLLDFLGRIDSQIKSRGYRIELGEIETAANTLPEIAECAVVSVPSDGFEGTAICCAFAPASGCTSAPSELRTALSSLLPTYMLPSRWSEMETLPKNVNGKIDRRRLRELFSDTTDRDQQN
jgi:amino acid adenylation domain-containing protein